ncbi:hypothetical protein llap_20605 [Limosa lapponica baueri]|uniref:PDZ domain-containing protein n=1 Tax=Limosa lapponica baueri TaxID=1758121 RepID=A0A2I0T5L9_LIMLA|nr:hypothetical protein llap_20605 [Limosa lapponica baueri]
MARSSSMVHGEKKVQEREVYAPGWRASLGAIGHGLEMSTSPGGSGGDTEAPMSRWLQLGVMNPILLVQLVSLKLAQSSRLTIRFPNQNDYSLEVYTCVCKIQEESPAHLSGLQTGDILASINGVNTDGFSHKQIVDLIKSSGNYLRLETINGAMFLRKMELETKLQLLKVI